MCSSEQNDSVQIKSVLDHMDQEKIKREFHEALAKGEVHTVQQDSPLPFQSPPQIVAMKEATYLLAIVGNCPSCGAPIYGHKVVAVGEQPKSVYSCDCWRRQGVVEQKFEDVVKTK